MSEEIYEGIPRSKILWSPQIDYGRCVSCGKCIDFCPTGVFTFEEKQGQMLTIVKNSFNCVVFCTGCEDVCPKDAITHPAEGETRKKIEELKAKLMEK